jgi:DNA invertase Pin-like site-specific DNA recombinase
MLIGYMNPSSDLPVDEQRSLLTAAGCERLLGSKDEMQGLLPILGGADMVVVSDLHAAARSARELVMFMADVAKTGAQFFSLGPSDSWASTVAAAPIIEVLFGLQRFEKEVRSRAAKHAIAMLSAKGVAPGRPFKMSPQQQQEAFRMSAEGCSQIAIAKHFGVAPSTINYLFNKDVKASNAARHAARRQQAVAMGRVQ